MSEISISLPSKAFLLGEYSMLSGRDALLVATRPRFIFKNNNIEGDYSHHGAFSCHGAKFLAPLLMQSYIAQQPLKLKEVLNKFYNEVVIQLGHSASGVEIVTQLYGGIILFNAATLTVQRLQWQFPDLGFFLLRTGSMVMTDEHLQQLRSNDFSSLHQVMQKVRLSFETNNRSLFCLLVNEYAEKLLTLGLTDSSTEKIITRLKQTQRIEAVKGCGALGADVILVVADYKEKTYLMQVFSELRLEVVATELDITEGYQIVEEEKMNGIESPLVLVDKNDWQVGIAAKMPVHRSGELHRAFSVVLFRQKAGKLETLIQKRARHKYHCGGYWSNSCCSHAAPGEELIKTAHKKLRQELNIDTALSKAGQFHYRAVLDNELIEHEFDHVFVGSYQEQVDSPNPEEVAECKWVPLDQLYQEIESGNRHCTPWLIEAIEIAKASYILRNREAANE